MRWDNVGAGRLRDRPRHKPHKPRRRDFDLERRGEGGGIRRRPGVRREGIANVEGVDDVVCRLRERGG